MNNMNTVSLCYANIIDDKHFRTAVTMYGMLDLHKWH